MRLRRDLRQPTAEQGFEMMTDDDLSTRERGRVLLTPRDALALEFAGEQYGVRLDLLQVLLARLAGRAEPLDESTARTHVKRWERAGMATSTRFYRELWTTPTARALQGRFRVWEPAPVKLQHVHAVAVTRLALEATEPDVLWESERVLRQQQSARFKKSQPTARIPDAAVELAGYRFGVEVETTVKAPRRYFEILRQYAGHWDRLVWYTPPALLDRLTPIIADAHAAADELLRKAAMGGAPETIVRPLPEVPGLDYGRLL
jgi:hypothetical protein